MTESSRLLLWLRWGALALAAVLIAARVATHGLDRFILVSAALFVLVGLMFQYVERQTRRPLKTHLRWALASFALGLVLVLLPLALGADLLVGAILWAGLSAAGLVWSLHYERTEPL
ncbi:hypothetical protein [Sphingopyxis sp. PET50]|uniref:hypothetical protein n=1 Tax=Sphingopyxis sp. PET50 TaxID=2976533 RepID=UPI0021B0069A|nr:hypothetical protein [Sphingopyxis sp. PET50]